jgi:hypothetical protein
MPRIAHCCCGGLRVETTGEPTVVLCHCRECQRRTGAPFGVGAYFKKDQVRAEGSEKVYVRGSDSGRKLRMHFCPDCGTTVYWEAELRPDQFGVAVGAFADPSFPAPLRSVWEEARHGWVTLDPNLPHFPRGTPPV